MTPHPRDYVYRLRIGNQEQYARLVPLHKRTEEMESSPWEIVSEGVVSGRRSDNAGWDSSWTESLTWSEITALTTQGERNPVRLLAGKYLRYSVGNDQPYRDIQRGVYADIRFALGDHPTEVYGDLAASRVVNVTSIESALDGVEVSLGALNGFMPHEGLDERDRDLLEIAVHALERIHSSLLERAQAGDALTPPGDEADADEKDFPVELADHDVRLEVARDRAGWELGDRDWADKIVAAYLSPEVEAAALDAEMNTPNRSKS